MTDATTAAPVARPSSAAQWLAVLVTVAVALGLAVALPRWADSTAPQDTALTTGERYTAGGVSLVVADGWSKTGGTALMVLNKGDAKLLILPPSASTDTPTASVTAVSQGYLTGGGTAGQVVTSTTASGLDVATIIVTAPDNVTDVLAFSDRSSLATGNAFVPAASWDKLKPEVDAMVASVQFEKAATS